MRAVNAPLARLRGLVLATFALAAGASADVPVVELQGVVHAVSAGHVVQALQKADADHAPVLVLRLDTPGGLDSAMRQIIDAMLQARTPVVAWVGPAGARAASAGFLILLSADLAAMAPGTNTGAAHPVSALGGKVDEVMSRKVAEDAAAYLRSKAERRRRNPQLAEKAVLESKAFTEREALEGQLIELVATDVQDLLLKLEGRELRRFDGRVQKLSLQGQRPVIVAMNWRQRLLSFVATPELLFLLLLGALAGLGAELSHPGLIFPGVVGLLCLILFLFASQVLPVNVAGVLLILLAVALFAAEVKVTSYGLLTLGGIVAMILGGLMLVEAEIPELRLGLGLLVPAAVLAALWAGLLVRLVVGARRYRVTTGSEGLIGARGSVETGLEPEGWVLVAGERWRARSLEPIAPGSAVVVLAVDGLKLQVRKEG